MKQVIYGVTLDLKDLYIETKETEVEGMFKTVEDSLEYVHEQYTNEEVLSLLRPYVAEWFKRKYSSFTPAQLLAIPEIKKGNNVLISSPTGTGKTLAAFLGILDELFKLGEEGKLEDHVYVVYVSPLRALNNDMKRNLIEPLKEISDAARKLGYEIPEIRVAVRTSDTKPYEKQRMIKTPPHILITTPESFSIALVAPRFRETLRNVKWVIVDEIHELCSSKRGAHLSLAIERLENFVGHRLIRIGLSATIAPLDEVAKFLVGFEDNGRPRKCKIVDARFAKPFEIRVVSPLRNIATASASEISEAIYSTLKDIILKHRTTLVFTNTRSATERVVFKLRKMFKENNVLDADKIEAHHSSLSRDLRLNVEEKLKRGELKVVVCSTSLELGIDIGYIDVVVLLSSPKSVSRLLQRIGRAGHKLRNVSKGIIVIVDRDDLVECTVLAKAALERKIDNVRIPKNPLDVLAQHIVGMALERKWKVDEAYRLVRRSYNYHTLSFNDFMSVLKYLSGKLVNLEHQRVYAKIWLDEEEGVFGRKGRGKTRMIYYMNSGTIPDEAKITVISDNGKYIGTIDEQFLQILLPGDIFVLGGRTYKFIRSYGSLALVKPVEGERPTVPTWFSEMLPLSYDSALLVGEFRRKIASMIDEGKSEGEILRFIMEHYYVEEHVAKDIYKYILEQYRFTQGIVPNDKLILIEVFGEGSKINIVFHTLFGRRVNDALSRAYAYVLSNLAGSNVKVTVTDNGFMLTITNINLSQTIITNLLSKVKSTNIDEILRRALKNTELLKRRFRHCAQRSFMILKRYMGREKSVHRLQLNAQNLLKVVEEIMDFPVLKETYREILEDFMDIKHAKEVLRKMEAGEIEVRIITGKPVPSPFAHNIVLQGYSDVVLMEDRRALLRKLYERVLEYMRTTK